MQVTRDGLSSQNKRLLIFEATDKYPLVIQHESHAFRDWYYPGMVHTPNLS